jgi:hypothetical protein
MRPQQCDEMPLGLRLNAFQPPLLAVWGDESAEAATRMSSWRSGVAAAMALAALAGAGWTAEPADGPGGFHRHGPGEASLFISPCGQPFRSTPGEADPVDIWFAQVDKNHDGRIDRGEFRADAAAFFRVLDRNHDGVIDSFEVAAYERQMVPEILGGYRGPPEGGGGSGQGQGRGGRHGGGGRASSGAANPATVLQGAAPFELIPSPEPVSAADMNLDGRITLAEFLAAADRRFDLLDNKQQGFLTAADLPKTPAQIEAAKHRPRSAPPHPA